MAKSYPLFELIHIVLWALIYVFVCHVPVAPVRLCLTIVPTNQSVCMSCPCSACPSVYHCSVNQLKVLFHITCIVVLGTMFSSIRFKTGTKKHAKTEHIVHGVGSPLTSFASKKKFVRNATSLTMENILYARGIKRSDLSYKETRCPYWVSKHYWLRKG